MNSKSEIDIHKIIREKVDSIEFEYDNNDWLKLEKDLPKGKLPNGNFSRNLIYKISAIVSGAIIITASIYWFIKPTENVIVEKNIASNTSNSKSFNTENPKNTSISLVEQATENEVKMTKNNSVKTIQNTESENITANIGEIKTNTQVKINSTSKNNIESKNSTKNSDLLNAEFSSTTVSGCNPLKVKFYPDVFSDTIFYLWKFGDGSFSTDISPTHIFEKSGSFDVSLNLKCFKSTKESFIEKNNYINVKSSLKSDFAFEGKNEKYSFKAISNKECDFQWLIDSKEYSTDPNIVYIFDKTGKHNVSLITSSLNGCADTITKPVMVKIEHNVFVPNAFTPDGDGRNDEFCAIYAEENFISISLNIFSKQGDLIFSSDHSEQCWNGNLKNGSQAVEGIYIWKLITKDIDGVSQSKMGSVNLMRKY